MEKKKSYFFHSQNQILPILSNWEKSIWSSEKFDVYEGVYFELMKKYIV